MEKVWKGFGKDLGRVREFENFGNAGFWRLKAPKTAFHWFWKLNLQAVIKSAASQPPWICRGAHGRRLGMRTAGIGGSPAAAGRLR